MLNEGRLGLLLYSAEGRKTSVNQKDYACNKARGIGAQKLYCSI